MGCLEQGLWLPGLRRCLRLGPALPQQVIKWRWERSRDWKPVSVGEGGSG